MPDVIYPTQVDTPSTSVSITGSEHNQISGCMSPKLDLAWQMTLDRPDWVSLGKRRVGFLLRVRTDQLIPPAVLPRCVTCSKVSPDRAVAGGNLPKLGNAWSG